jgi:hypothetical protein
MHLIQILLPVCDNKGRPFPRNHFARTKAQLTGRFDGLTAYSQSPADGLWKRGKGIKRDQIVVYEVMARSIDKSWWRNYRTALEKLFKQESVVIRTQRITLL